MNVSLLNPKHISFPFIIFYSFFHSLILSFSCISHPQKYFPSLASLTHHRSKSPTFKTENEGWGWKKRIVHVSESFLFLEYCVYNLKNIFIAVDVKNDLPLISSLTGKFNFFSYFFYSIQELLIPFFTVDFTHACVYS